MRPEMFRKVNGFSIVYFGWGREDDDMRIRFVIESFIALERLLRLPNKRQSMLRMSSLEAE